MRLKVGILAVLIAGLGLAVGYIALQPTPKESLNTEAINMYWSGGYDALYDVFDAFDATLKEHPEDAEALAYRGALNESWYYEEEAAKADYEQARTLDPISGLVDGLQAYNAVTLLEDASADTSAIQTQAQVAISAGNPIGMLALGELALKQKDYAGAVEHFTHAINSDNKQFVGFTARLFVSRAEALRHLSRYEEALIDANRALELAPEYDQAILVQKSIQWTTGDVEKTLVTGINEFWYPDYEQSYTSFDIFDAILLGHPDNAQALAYRGAMNESWYYDADAAETDYARALELDPTSGLVTGLRAYVALTETGEDYKENAEAAVLAGNPIGSYVMAHAAEYDGDLEHAAAYYTQAIKNDSQLYVGFTTLLYAGRGEIYRQLTRYDEAKADVKKTLELDPENYTALNTRNIMSWSTRPVDKVVAEGITYFWSADDSYKAYQLFDVVLQNHPDNAQALAYYAAITVSYDPEGANDKFAQSQAIESTGLVEGLQAYNALENDDDDAAAEAKAKDSAALGHPLGSFILGRVAYRADDYETALDFYAKALETDSKLYPTFTAEIYVARARALRFLERYADTIPDLTTAIKLVPDDFEAVALRGNSYRMLHQYPRAIADFDAALDDDPDYMYALGRRADTFYFMGKYEQALADVNRVLEDDPDNTFSLNTRANTYKKLKNYEAALADLTHSLEIDPKDSTTLGNRARLYLAMGDTSKALIDVNQALALLPDDLNLLSARGWIYRNLEDYDEALADFNYVLERTPNDDYALEGRGGTYAAMGETDKALADFGTILTRNPEHTAVLLRRARLYKSIDKKAEAMADVKAALALEPDNKDAKDLLGELMNPLK